MTHQIKEEIDNPEKHRNDDGTINDDTEENGLEYNGVFMGFTRMGVLPEKLTRGR